MTITEVIGGGPAQDDGFLDGDVIYNFGGIIYKPGKSFEEDIQEKLDKNLGEIIPVRLLRKITEEGKEDTIDNIRLYLTPKKWSGRDTFGANYFCGEM